MRYIVVVVVVVAILMSTGFAASAGASEVSQRIVPLECTLNAGQPDQSYLSEADCDALLNPQPPVDPVDPVDPGQPGRPDTPTPQNPSSTPQFARADLFEVERFDQSGMSNQDDDMGALHLKLPVDSYELTASSEATKLSVWDMLWLLLLAIGGYALLRRRRRHQNLP